METRTFVNDFERKFIFPAYCLGILGLTGLAGDTISTYLKYIWAISTITAIVTRLLKINTTCRFDFVAYSSINWILVIIAQLLLPEWFAIKMILAVVSVLILYKLLTSSFYYVCNPSGPYGAGVKDIVTEGKTTLSTLVFYPIEKEEYDRNAEDTSKSYTYLLDGEEEILGMIKALPAAKQMFKSKIFKNIPENKVLLDIVCRDSYLFRIRGIVEGKLHKDFTSGHKKLTPIIYSPGLNSKRAHYAATGALLASYGCIVYIFNHTDESGNIYKDYNVTPPEAHLINLYDPVTKLDSYGAKYEHEEVRIKMLNHRMGDIEVMLNYIKNESIKEFKHIDLDKLVSMGLSMGGMTAIEACKRGEKDFKAWVAFDPYFCARHKDIEDSDDYCISQPMLMLTAETFDDSHFFDTYDQRKVRGKFFKNYIAKNGKIGFDIVLKDSAHCSSMDEALLKPEFMSSAETIGAANKAGEKYLEFIETTLAFLEKNKLLPVTFSDKPNQHLT